MQIKSTIFFGFVVFVTEKMLICLARKKLIGLNYRKSTNIQFDVFLSAYTWKKCVN